MGMYNYIFWDCKINGPIPKKQLMPTAFQTKSIQPCNLDCYYVCDSGVYIAEWRTDWGINSKGDKRPNLEWFRENIDKLRPVKLDGAISFYTTIEDTWVEYVAGYEEGNRMFCYLVRYGDKQFYKIL